MVYVHAPASLPPLLNGSILMMTYATAGVRELLTNWLQHVERLQLPILVAAMDAGVISQCRAERFQCLDWSSTADALERLAQAVRQRRAAKSAKKPRTQ